MARIDKQPSPEQQIEQMIIGSMLKEPASIDLVPHITPSDFETLTRRALCPISKRRLPLRHADRANTSIDASRSAPDDSSAGVLPA